MALIIHFVEKPSTRINWRSEVECGFTIGHCAGRRILHLETYGSGRRQRPGKVSQSIELDEKSALELAAIILRAFPGAI